MTVLSLLGPIQSWWPNDRIVIFLRHLLLDCGLFLLKTQGVFCKNAATVNPETQSVLYY